MAEYIEREAVRRAVFDAACVLESVPAANVVEVVRCKDCKHWEWFGAESHKGVCVKCDCLMYDDDFCSYGERRGDAR